MIDLTIDYETPLAGTVKYYEQHLILCCGHSNWAAKIEDDGGFTQLLVLAIKEANFSNPVRVTACDAPSMGNGFDLFLYPAAQRLSGLTEADIPILLQQLQQLQQPVVLQSEKINRLSVSPLVKPVWLVCTHGARDLRCELCGPKLLNVLRMTLQRMSLDDQVEVWASSHIGGHSFAANVLCYPSGNWYGRVTSNDVAELVEAELLNKQLLNRLWRGQMGLTPEEQLNKLQKNV